ncbi:MAG: phosphatase PAP2 family protein [Dehalococcoidia bacterium]|nr:phosphatase PAP2 family protein [Dehalococcoidia bacterium]
MPTLARPAADRAPIGRTVSPHFLDSSWFLVLQALALLAMTVTVATRTWQDHLWLGLALTGAAAAAWAPELSRRRVRLWWFAYVAGIFVYTLLRSVADDAGMPVQTMYVIDVDRILFFGQDPVVWLQRNLFSPAAVSWLDVFAVQVHWSFFIAPHVAAVLIFLWRRDLFPRYAVVVVGTMYAGLLLFFVVPTSPPWLAAQAGDIPQVFRIMDFVGGRVDAGTYRSFYASLGEPNSVAAMPSIHMAVTVAMYLWARDHYPKLAWPLFAYSVLMGLSLVYLAEHYAFDLLMGAAIAFACHLVTRRLVPARIP